METRKDPKGEFSSSHSSDTDNNPPVSRKIETRDFFLIGDEKIETLFPIPVDARFPDFQRAIGMAEGTIREVNDKGNGFIEIEGTRYPLKENRSMTIKKRYPLTKYTERKVSFTFYPTTTMEGIKILKLRPNDPPFIKIANFRKELKKQGAFEAIGNVKSIFGDFFTVSIWSKSSQKEYIVNIFGSCKADTGDFVLVHGLLKNGIIRMEDMRVLLPGRGSSRYSKR